MRCKEILARLSEYLDGELDSSLREALHQHLAGCGPCQIVVDNVRQTITVYKSGRPIELPPELHRQLCQLLRTRWEKIFPSSEA
jgi:anti-sigma factor (TIGR02949 family)